MEENKDFKQKMVGYVVFIFMWFLWFTKILPTDSNKILIYPSWINFVLVGLFVFVTFKFGAIFTQIKSPGLFFARISAFLAMFILGSVVSTELSNPNRSQLLLIVLVFLILLLSFLNGMTFGKQKEQER